MDTSYVSLSTSGFGDASACLKRYEYRWVDRLAPLPRDIGEAVRRGTWIHRCLQLLDEGADYNAELGRMAAWAVDHEIDPHTVGTLVQDVAQLVQDYVDYWRNREKDDGGPFETVVTEKQVEWFPNPNRRLTATVDRIVRDARGQLWIWERKSTSDIPDANWRTVDPQTLIQYAVSRFSEEYPVVGVIFDYVGTDPGPSVQVYKPNKTGRGGRVYDGVLGKSVRSRAFEAAVPEIRAQWQDGPDYVNADDYVQAMRLRLVNEGGFFQRYRVLRPDDHTRLSLKDVAVTMNHVQQAQESGHYPRSFNILTCRRFCFYGRICSQEYLLGHPSEALRQQLYTVDSPEIRSEGRSDEASYPRR